MKYKINKTIMDIKIWEEKIKEKRKNTDFRVFIKEIASWFPVTFYKNNSLISRYPVNDRIKKVIKNTDYAVERDSFLKYAIDFNWEDFESKFNELIKNVEQPNTTNYWWIENSDYADVVFNTKNAYLSFQVVYDNENVLYSFCVKYNCRNIFNCVMVRNNCENIFHWVYVINSFNVFYSKNIVDSNNIWFSKNLMWCSECIFCDWLSNMKFCINNKKLPEEEYFKQKNEILKQKKNFTNWYKNLVSIESIQSKSFVLNSSDIEKWIMIYWVNVWKNVILMWSDNTWSQRIYDSLVWGSGWSTDFYWTSSCWTAHNLYACESIWMSSNLYYCMNLHHCSFCIWCVWLKNKSYCILNKEYSKEEWYILANKIFEEMEKKWTLGNFFPWNNNPFYFNDTLAYLIDDSFTKEEVTREWYLWRDEETKVDIPTWIEIINNSWLDKFEWFWEDWKWIIEEEILDKAVKDEKWNIYKIVKMEYDFLIKYELPLPTLHWLDRIKMWFTNNYSKK